MRSHVGNTLFPRWERFFTLHKLLDGVDKHVVFLRCLGGDPEVMGGKTAEVGGVADEDVVVPCQIVFELSSGIWRYLRQKKVGLCLGGFDTQYLVQALTQSFRFCQIDI